MSDKFDWLDCTSDVVAVGANQGSSSQITRIYFESFGEPCCHGEVDGDRPETRRVIEGRAVRAIHLLGEDTPTIVFDVGGDEYRFTSQSVYSDDEQHILVHTYENRGKRYTEPVGTKVAFAVPDHLKLTPHLDRPPKS